MKYLALLMFPVVSFAQSLSVGLYENHDDYLKYSRAYQLNWELFKLAAQHENITLITEQHLWVRALESIKDKKLDALIGAYYTTKRADFSYFSSPKSIDDLYIYSKSPNTLSLEQIKQQGLIVGVTTDSIGDSFAQQIGIKGIYRKGSSEKIFDLLMNDRIHFAIFSSSIAQKHCATWQPHQSESCMHPSPLPGTSRTFHTIYSQTQKNKRLAHRIDAAIESFINNEQAIAIFKKIGYDDTEYQEWIQTREKWHENALLNVQ